MMHCRIMVFGQETNDWEGPFPHPQGMGYMLRNYEEFFISGYCYTYGGQFWNGISRFVRAFKDRYSASYGSVGLLWNNVIKLGRAGNKGAPNEDMLTDQDEWFDVVNYEVEILKPNIVVFFSGPNYDRFIERILGDASFERFSVRDERQLARVTSPYLPARTVRTYHPNYLWRNGFDQYLDEILGAIDPTGL